MPAWMKWYKDKNKAQFERFAREIFGLNSAEEGINALENWFKSIKSPIRLEEANIPKSDIPKIAENAHGLASLWGMGGFYTQSVIEQILQNA